MLGKAQRMIMLENKRLNARQFRRNPNLTLPKIDRIPPQCGERKSNFVAAMGFFRLTEGRKRKRLWGVSARYVFLAWAMATTACGPVAESPKPNETSSEWLEFEGSWNAAGSRP